MQYSTLLEILKQVLKDDESRFVHSYYQGLVLLENLIVFETFIQNQNKNKYFYEYKAL